MEQETIIAVSVLGAGCLLLVVLVAVLFSQVSSLRRRLDDVFNSGRLRVQKLKLDSDKNHAFHNPTISPDEELARRGYSMYSGEDVESGRQATTERQTGGQLLDQLTRELDYRNQRQLHEQEQQQRQQHQQQEQHLRQQQQQLEQQLRQQQQQQENQEQKQRQQHQQEQKKRQQQQEQQLRQQQQQLEQQLRQQQQQQEQQEQQQRQQQEQQQRPPSPPYQPSQTPHQAPSFLLQSIEENKRKTRQSLVNPMANGDSFQEGNRQSVTNPNFIY